MSDQTSVHEILIQLVEAGEDYPDRRNLQKTAGSSGRI